jgi:hypothetical protein
MIIEKVNIKDVVLNPNNPRIIKDEKFKKLIKSIKDFPEMLEVRPIVVDDDMVVLGGNMRLKACQSAGLTEVPIIKFSNIPEEKKKEFVVKDNVGYGEWDYSALTNWDKELLKDSLDDWEITSIFGIGEDDYEDKVKDKLKDNVVNVDDYIKQNIFFLNEYMLEFEDEDIKKAVRNLQDITTKEHFLQDIKKIIIQYGKNSI